MSTVKELLMQALELLESAPEPVPSSAPFGINPLTNEPNFSPAYEGAKNMWKAAGREGVFNIMPLLGGGIRQGAEQMYDGFQPNLQLIEDVIVELGQSPWGRDWVSHDANAAKIDKEYCIKFTRGRDDMPPVDPDFPDGYYVVQINVADETQGYERRRP